jgi:hypothetical protein
MVKGEKVEKIEKAQKSEGGEKKELTVDTTKGEDGEFSAERLAMFGEAFAPILGSTKT